MRSRHRRISDGYEPAAAVKVRFTSTIGPLTRGWWARNSASSTGAGLAATAAGAALLYTLTGFGFAVLSITAFVLFVDPPQAVQLVIIISTALSIVTLPGLWRAVVPALLLRLTLGSIAGLPLGLIALRHADPVVVRRLIGTTILVFSGVLLWVQLRGPNRHTALPLA